MRLGGLIGALSAFPFFMALDAPEYLDDYCWRNFTWPMLRMIWWSVCISRFFASLFGTAYRYSGARSAIRCASIIGGGFTPMIAAALVIWGDGSWHYVAIYLADRLFIDCIGCSLDA